MTTIFVPGNLQWTGTATETTYGVPVAAPTTWIPSDSPTWHPTVNPLVDMNLRGSMAKEFAQVQGIRYDTVTFKTGFYLDSIFQLFRAALGLPDVISGSSDPYTHKTSLQSGNNGQPAGTTVFWVDGAGKAYQMAGSQVSDLKLTIKQDGYAQAEITYIGLPAQIIAAPTNTPTTYTPMPSWNSVFTIAGVGNASYSEIDLEIKRATEMIPVVGNGQSPLAIYCGEANVSGTFTSVYQGSTDINLVDFLANTQPAITLKVSPAADAVHSITLQMSKVAYDDIAPAGTNKWIEIKSTIKGIANTTDVAGGGNYSPMLVTMLGPQSTAL